jgi:uncharacterized protein
LQRQTEKKNVADLHGRFVWYELMTTDMEAAKAFYSKVVGWGTEDASTPSMSYSLFIFGRSSVGGVMSLPQDAGEVGAMPRWVGYVAVDDVDAAAQRVTELGGAVYTAPTDVPDVSRYSVVADPQGAAFVLVKWLRPRPAPPSELKTPGRVGWHELLAADPEKALAFYRELFGWEDAGAETSPAGPYQLFSSAGQTFGSMHTKPPTMPVAFWLYSFNVGDIDAAMKRVKTVGGEIIYGPMQVPESLWVVECKDPQGAEFALVGKRSSDAIGTFERVSARDPSDPRARLRYR